MNKSKEELWPDLKLVIDFMTEDCEGCKKWKTPCGSTRIFSTPPEIEGDYELALPYTTSWDALMPVVKKIAELSLSSTQLYRSTEYEVLVENLGYAELSLSFQKVVNFIKLYNKLLEEERQLDEQQAVLKYVEELFEDTTFRERFKIFEKDLILFGRGEYIIKRSKNNDDT